MLAWTKQPADAVRAAAGPFVANVSPKGDGRWNWAVYADGSANATATGIASSLGAAKTACEQFVKRSGRV
jgi:hypothetical protein